MALRITTFSLMRLNIMIISKMTLSIMTLSTKILRIMTLSRVIHINFNNILLKLAFQSIVIVL
jgi:hypothetical protein